MRRISLILTVALVCLAGVTLISGATAGNFDEGKMGCTGEDPATCPTATVGQSYSLTLYLTPPDGGRGEDFNCATFHATSGSLPPGLSISDEGILSGTPTQAGTFEFYLTVRYDKTPSCSKAPSDDRFIIKVNPGSAPPPPAAKLIVTTTSLPDATVNQAYTAPALAAGGGTVTSWALAGGTLPPGLNLAANGVISGTPTQGGTFTFIVQANGSPAPDTKQLSLFVSAPLGLQTLVNRTPPARGLTAKKAVGVQLKTGVKAVGGRPPYAFTATGSLPPGMTLDSATGAISGAGTAAGRYPFTVTVTDGTGAKVSVEWNITILALIDFAKGKGLPAGRVGDDYSARIPVRGKDAANAQFAVAGEIPPGLEVGEDGRLTGTLLKAGVYRLKVFAFPESGGPVSKVFRFRVRG